MLTTPSARAAGAAMPTGPSPSGGLRLVHAAQSRTPALLPASAEHGALPSSTGSSAPAAAAVAAPGLQPLTAEADRTEASAAAAATAGAGASEDIEDLSRRLLRIIERRIAIERERRGVDRWAR